MARLEQHAAARLGQPFGFAEWPEVRVWWEQPSAIPDLDARAALLSDDERERIARLHRSGDRANAAAAWSLVRLTLGEACGVDPRLLQFERTCSRCGRVGHGKPRLLGHGLRWHFSLAHAGDRVVVAVSANGQVGVDVESTAQGIDALRELVLHAAEPPAAGMELLRVWTRKEALLKATGDGLARPMSSLDLAANDLRFVVRDLVCGTGYVAAVAVPLAPVREDSHSSVSSIRPYGGFANK